MTLPLRSCLRSATGRAILASAMTFELVRRSLLPALTIAAIGGCGGGSESAPTLAEHVASPVILYAGIDRRTVNDVPAESMTIALKRQFELLPDARFLLAVADVHHLASGAPYDTLRAELRDGTWAISYAGTVVGTLPRLAGFNDADLLLTGWAHQQLVSHPLAGAAPSPRELQEIDRLLGEISSLRTAQALTRMDSAWHSSGGSAALLEPAARGLLALVLQLNDANQRGDRLFASALALDVLSRAASGRAPAGGSGLLAHWSGYTVDARRIAATLDTASAIRSYIEGDLPRLRAASSEKDASALTKFLFLRGLAASRDGKKWKEYAAQLPPSERTTPGVISVALLTRDFDLDGWLPLTMPDALLDELDAITKTSSYWRHFWRDTFGGLPRWDTNRPWGRAPSWGRSVGDNAAQVQLRAGALGASVAGPLLDAATYRTYLDAQLATAFAAGGAFLVSSLADADRTAAFGLLLQHPRFDAPTRMQGRAIELLAMRDKGVPIIDATDTLLGESWDGGEPIRSELLDRALDGVAMNNGPYTAAVRGFSASLDSRVTARIDLAWLAQYEIVDLNLADELYTSAIAATGDDQPAVMLQQALFAGDTREVLRIASDSTCPRRVRTEAIEKLVRRGVLAAAAIDTAYARLVVGAPANDDAWGSWLEYLEKSGQLEEAEMVARLRIAAVGADSISFGRIYAATTMAHVLQMQGKPAEAWAVISPVIRSGQGGAMIRGALILADLERYDEAARLASSAMRRYPGDRYARASLAEIYWRAGLFEKAADVLSPEAFPFGAGTWPDDFGEAYVNAFAKQPISEAERAVHALVARSVRPHQAKGIAIYADAHGRPDLAFSAQTVLATAATVPTQRVQLLLPAFGYLAAWKGDSAAHAWYRAHIPKLEPTYMIDYMFSYLPDRPDLLWDEIDVSRAKYPTEVWLRRTSVEILRKSPAPARRAELMAHYATRSTERYDRMARVLLGIDPPAAILPLACDAHGRTEVAYYLALKALHDGRFDQAADWFAVSVESGSARDSEFGWSQKQLGNWEEAETNPRALMAAAGRAP